MRRVTITMKGMRLAIACSLIAGLGWYAGTANADESGCITCHVDEQMLVQNLAAVKGKTSAKQSGSG